jgi:flagellin
LKENKMTTINYNVAANYAANTLTANDRKMDEVMTRLSTGVRINNAADDPGAYGAYIRLQAGAITQRQALENTNAALGYLQTVDAAAGQIQNILFKLKELAVQGSSSTLTNEDRYAIQKQYENTGLEWTRIVQDTDWQGTTGILAGADLTVSFGSSSSLTFKIDDWTPSAQAANGLEIATGAITVGANNSAGDAFIDFSVTGGTAATGAVPAYSREHLITVAAARAATTKITAAINGAAASRALVGGHINTLNQVTESLSATAVAYESGASIIGDANYAAETSRLASTQIISQAASAMLAQANAQASTVLTLLK